MSATSPEQLAYYILTEGKSSTLPTTPVERRWLRLSDSFKGLYLFLSDAQITKKAKAVGFDMAKGVISSDNTPALKALRLEAKGPFENLITQFEDDEVVDFFATGAIKTVQPANMLLERFKLLGFTSARAEIIVTVLLKKLGIDVKSTANVDPNYEPSVKRAWIKDVAEPSLANWQTNPLQDKSKIIQGNSEASGSGDGKNESLEFTVVKDSIKNAKPTLGSESTKEDLMNASADQLNDALRKSRAEFLGIDSKEANELFDIFIYDDTQVLRPDADSWGSEVQKTLKLPTILTTDESQSLQNAATLEEIRMAAVKIFERLFQFSTLNKPFPLISPAGQTIIGVAAKRSPSLFSLLDWTRMIKIDTDKAIGMIVATFVPMSCMAFNMSERTGRAVEATGGLTLRESSVIDHSYFDFASMVFHVKRHEINQIDIAKRLMSILSTIGHFVTQTDLWEFAVHLYVNGTTEKIPDDLYCGRFSHKDVKALMGKTKAAGKASLGRVLAGMIAHIHAQSDEWKKDKGIKNRFVDSVAHVLLTEDKDYLALKASKMDYYMSIHHPDITQEDQSRYRRVVAGIISRRKKTEAVAQ